MIDTLCFSSGGFQGLLFISSLKCLVDNKYIDLDKITTYLGTSIGAIISFLLIIGYTPDELYIFFKNYDYKNLELQFDLLLLEKNLENFGLDNCDNCMDLIKFLFEKKSKLKLCNLTLKELFILTKKKFIINTTNFNKGKEVILNYETTPDLLVIQALRMTISIPIIYTPVLYKNEYYVDGALSNDILLSHCNPETTLGFYIEEINNFELKSLQDLILGSILILSNRNKINNNNDNYKVIKFKKVNSKIISLNITQECIEETLNSGMKTTQEFILKDLKKNIKNTKINIKNKSNNIIKETINNIIIKIEKKNYESRAYKAYHTHLIREAIVNFDIEYIRSGFADTPLLISPRKKRERSLTI